MFYQGEVSDYCYGYGRDGLLWRWERRFGFQYAELVPWVSY